MSTPAFTEKVIVSFMGPPGSGKGTVSQQWRDEFGFGVLSTGNLCRAHIAEQTEIGSQLKHYIESGQLVPDETISLMVAQWLEEQRELGASIILDGYPRTQPQAEASIEMARRLLPDYAMRVVIFELPDEVIVQRVVNRRVCSNKACQRVYSVVKDDCARRGSCAKCGSELICRKDDTELVIRKRLADYHEYRQAMLDVYAQHNIEVVPFDVAGLSYDQMFQRFDQLVSL